MKVKGVWRLLLSATIAFLTVGIICTIILRIQDPKLPVGTALYNGFTGMLFGVDLLFSVLVSLIVLHEDIRHEQQKNWDSLIKSRDLVLHPEIDYFESKHLAIAEEIIFPQNGGGPSECLFALDSTPPSEWWTNNMLGYLALQARWSSESPERTVSRFFVWSTCQFTSLVGMKIIQLHRLFGFETYIISQHCWDRIARRLNINKKFFHECLVWDNGNAKPSKVEEMSPTTYGYKSYWRLKDGQFERDNQQENLINVKKKICFFDPLSQDDANQYRDILSRLRTDADVTAIHSTKIDGIQNEIVKHAEKYDD